MTIAPQNNTWLNLTAGAAGVDKWGKVWVNIRAAFIASGFWRQKGAGDGLAASTTGTTNIFTANGGLGYVTAGSTWPLSVGTANSFTNALAWFVMEELDGTGTPTGRQWGVQRSSSTVAGNEQTFNVRYTFTGFSGATNATTAPSGGTSSPLMGSSAFGTAGVNFNTACGMATSTISTANTLNFSVLIPNASETKGVAPFAAWAHIGSDLGWTFFCDVLKDVASADAHPCVVNMDSWSSAYGESFVGTFSMRQGTATGAIATDTTGAAQPCSIEGATDQAARTQPGPGSATAQTADSDGKYTVRPVVWSVKSGASIAAYKGVSKYLTWLVGASTSYFFPATFHATVADPVEPPRLSMGWMQWPWIVGTYCSPGNAANNRTDVRGVLQTATATVSVFSALSPPPGAISRTQAISVSATDTAAIKFVAVTIQYSSPASAPSAISGDPASATYTSDFDAASTITPISGGYALSVVPDAGWSRSFTFVATVVNASGTSTSISGSYTVPTGGGPTLVSAAPTTGSTLAGRSQAVDVVLNVPNGEALTVITVRFPDLKRTESAYVRGAFSAEYTAGGSTRSVVGTQVTYHLIRDDSWPDDPQIDVYCLDNAGLEL